MSEDPCLPEIEAAITAILSDQKGLTVPPKTATEIYAATFSTLSAQHMASAYGLDHATLFRQIGFNAATIALLCRKLAASQDELTAIKSIYNLP